MTPTEAAVNAHSSTPMAAATIYQEWADSPERKSSLNNMMISARHRLLVAMGIAQTAQVMLGFSEHMSWQRAAERSRGVRLPR